MEINFENLKGIVASITDYIKDLIDILKAFIASWKQIPAAGKIEETTAAEG